MTDHAVIAPPLRPALGAHDEEHRARRVWPGDLHYDDRDLAQGAVAVVCRLEDSIIISQALQSTTPTVHDIMRRLTEVVLLAHGDEVLEWERDMRKRLRSLD